LNRECLSVRGLQYLSTLLSSSQFDIRVPEEGALLTFVWLVNAGYSNEAAEIVDVIQYVALSLPLVLPLSSSQYQFCLSHEILPGPFSATFGSTQFPQPHPSPSELTWPQQTFHVCGTRLNRDSISLTQSVVIKLQSISCSRFSIDSWQL
jgi:hypothetical protein